MNSMNNFFVNNAQKRFGEYNGERKIFFFLIRYSVKLKTFLHCERFPPR